MVAPDLAWPALDWALRTRRFNPLREAYLQILPLRVDWQGTPMLRSYRQGVALLRMHLIGGDGPKAIAPLLAACLRCHEAAYLHPLVDICARPENMKTAGSSATRMLMWPGQPWHSTFTSCTAAPQPCKTGPPRASPRRNSRYPYPASSNNTNTAPCGSAKTVIRPTFSVVIGPI